MFFPNDRVEMFKGAPLCKTIGRFFSIDEDDAMRYIRHWFEDRHNILKTSDLKKSGFRDLNNKIKELLEISDKYDKFFKVINNFNDLSSKLIFRSPNNKLNTTSESEEDREIEYKKTFVLFI